MQPSGGVPELQKYFFFLCVCFTSEDKAYLIAFLGKKIKLVLSFKEIVLGTMAVRHGIFSPFTTLIFCFSLSDLV